MKKILCIVGKMNVGGIENYIMTVLRNINKKNFEISLLYITEENCFYDEEIKSLGNEIIRITGRSQSLVKHIKELKNVLYEGKYDIVHIHYGNALCFIDAFVAKKLAKVPKVIVHSHNSQGCNYFVNNLFKNTLYKCTDEMITCSPKAGKWMFPKKVQKKVKILSNGIDTNKFIFNIENRTKLKKELNFSDDNIIIGEVARFNTVKNQKYLIEIAKKLEPSKYKFLLIGSGDKKQEFINLVDINNLNDMFVLIDNVYNPQDYLNVMDLFVMPSLFEGLPISLVEAQCNGLTCLISENIDKNVDLTGNIRFLKIGNEDIVDWVKTIENSSIERDLEAKNKIIQSGYDIKESIKKLEAMYLE